MTTDFRALCAELTAWAEKTSAHYFQPPDVMLRARAALADGPAVPEGREPAAVAGQPSDGEVAELVTWLRETGDTIQPSHLAEHQRYKRAAELLQRQVLQPPADGEVAELVTWLRETGDLACQADAEEGQRYWSAAELLQRQALVPVSVSDALIKAECALSDIAEGEPMTDEGDPLKWAERRCADTLAIIRPTMMQHKIRTSEWPPVAATAKPLPEVGE